MVAPSGAAVDEQPVAGQPRGGPQGALREAERGQIHDAGRRAGPVADPLVLGHDVAAGLHHHELLPLGRAVPGRERDLRVLDPERGGLADLELDQFVQVRGPGRHVLEPHQRDLRGGVGDGQRDARRALAEASKAARMAAMTSSGLATFDEVSEGTMAPSGSGSTAQASSVTPAPRPETATAVTRSAAISIATGGGGVRRIEGILIRRRSPC